MKNIIHKILLQEGRVEDMKKKYPEHTDAVDFLVSNDPSNNNKYLQWMMKQVVKNNQQHGYVLTLTKHFHKNVQKLQKKDINQYKTLDELQEALSKLKPPKPKDELEGEYEKLYETDEILVVKPLTHKASCKYGSGTKWCITMKNTDKYWNHYTRKTSNFAGIDWYNVKEVVKDVKRTWLDKLLGKPGEVIEKEIKEFIEEFPVNVLYFIIVKKRMVGFDWDDEVKARIPKYEKVDPKDPMGKLALLYKPDRADFGDMSWVKKGGVNYRRDMFSGIESMLDAAHNNLRIFNTLDKKVTLKEINRELGEQFTVAFTHTEHDFQKTRDIIINEFLPNIHQHEILDRVFPLPGAEGSDRPISWITTNQGDLKYVDTKNVRKGSKGGVTWGGGWNYKGGG